MSARSQPARPLVLVVRPEPGASLLAGKLRRDGFGAVAAPSTEIRRLAHVAPQDLAGAQAVVFTSAAAARLAGADLAETVTPLPQAICVGAATAKAARAAGFKDVLSVDGAAVDLARALASLDPAGGRIVHLAGRDLVSDLGAEVADAAAKISAPFEGSVEVKRIVLYAAEELDALPAEARQALASGQVDAVVALSGRAGAAFLRLLSERERRELSSATLVAISERAARSFQSVFVARRIVAAEPNENATRNALKSAFGR